MEIISYTKSELQELIDSDFFKKLNKIPISKHRAISHINNPYCADDDILLWVAYQNETLLGYSSVLPDRIAFKGREEKIYWPSSIWREESERKSALAITLLFKVFEQYKSRIFVTDLLPQFEKTYSKLRLFKPVETEIGTTFYRNLAFSHIIKRRFPKLKYIIPVYSLLEKCFNFTLFLGRKLTSKKIKTNFSIVENTVFDAEFDEFVKNYCIENQLIERNSDYFNWILKYPWVVQGKPDNESERYYFSSVSKQFEYHSLKIYDKQKLIGFIFLKIRDKRLAVSFSYLDDVCSRDAVAYILKLANTKDLDVITVFDKKLLSELIKKRTKYLFSKKTEKKYFFPRNFDITSSFFQEGDGDMVFT